MVSYAIDKSGRVAFLFAAMAIAMPGVARAECDEYGMNCTDSPKPPGGGGGGGSPTCKLDTVAASWVNNKTLISKASVDANNIIAGIETAMLLEADPNRTDIKPAENIDFAKQLPLEYFGPDLAVQTKNRQTVLDGFKDAKTQLWKSIKEVAGSADPVCQTCFTLRDWYVLSTALDYMVKLHKASAQSSSLKAVGLNSATQFQKSIIQIGSTQGNIVAGSMPIRMDEITDAALRTASSKIGMKAIKVAVCKATAIDLEGVSDTRYQDLRVHVLSMQGGMNYLIDKNSWTGKFSTAGGEKTVSSLTDKVGACTAEESLPMSIANVRAKICDDPEVVTEMKKKVP